MKNNILKFGKYRGIDIQLVEERDPQYMIWLVENVKMFKNYYTKEKLNKIKEDIALEKELKRSTYVE
jgi:hypothetical protein